VLFLASARLQHVLEDKLHQGLRRSRIVQKVVLGQSFRNWCVVSAIILQGRSRKPTATCTGGNVENEKGVSSIWKVFGL
jgi:hypothetical protein